MIPQHYPMSVGRKFINKLNNYEKKKLNNMANIVEFTVQIRDIASGPMRSLTNNANSVFNNISSRISRVSAQVRRLDSQIQGLTRSRQISIDTGEIRKASRQLAALEAQCINLSKTEDKAEGGKKDKKESKVKDWLDKGIGKMFGLGTDLIEKGMSRDREGDAIEIMGGKKGGKLKNDLNTFADRNGMGDDVFKDGRKLLASGIVPENIIPGLKMLGDVALGDSGRMKALTDVFAETASTGKLAAGDLPKFIDAGFNPLLEMSRKTGRTTAELREDVDKGKISFQALAETLQYATGPMGTFHNGMQRMGESPAGKIAALQETIQSLGVSIGMALLPALGFAADLLSRFAGNKPLMYEIAAGIGAMAIAWGLYSAWTQRAVIWQAILDGLMLWPIVLVGVLVGGLVWLISNLEGVGKTFTSIWQIIKSGFGLAKVLFRESFQEWVYTFDFLYLKAKSIFQYIGQLISNTARAIDLALKRDFSGAKSVLTAHISTDADKEISALNRKRAAQLAENSREFAGHLQSVKAGWNGIGIKWNKRKNENGSSPSEKWIPTGVTTHAALGSAGTVPATVGETAKGIGGGGQRNQVINIAKLGVDQISLHAASVTEGAAEIRAIFIEMFNQVINSGNAAVNPN
ncbi:hypothetical protein ABID99_004959 [Mucilaginibacter sp. OAE612]|uniref:hypothetical protein n=1 Tax=Mucilaginibacter sp. OAE612 TaxID=3156444 RepID=UPI00359DE579